jgi:hypothetical protein
MEKGLSLNQCLAPVVDPESLNASPKSVNTLLKLLTHWGRQGHDFGHFQVA